LPPRRGFADLFLLARLGLAVLRRCRVSAVGARPLALRLLYTLVTKTGSSSEEDDEEDKEWSALPGSYSSPLPLEADSKEKAEE
jgi:hypothetical protein